MGGDHHTATAPVVQQVAGIGEGGSQRHGTRRGIDRPADGVDTSLLGIGLAIAQLEADGRGLLHKRLHRAVLSDEINSLVFGNREIGIHLVVVGHRDQRLADVTADERTHMPGNHRGNTADGALHLSIGKLTTGIALLSLGLGQGGLCFGKGVLHGLHRDVAHHTVFLKLTLVLVVHACRSQLGLGTATLGDRHLQTGTKRHLVNDEQRLTLTDGVALVDADADDGA